MRRYESFLILGVIFLGVSTSSFFLTSDRIKQQPKTLLAAAESAQPSEGSKEANESCKKQLGKVEDITKVECVDTEKAAGETIKGHCTTSGQCKAEKICGKDGTCKALPPTDTSRPCNTEMGGGKCRQESLDIINNYPKELNYYATEDIRKQLRGELGSPDETQYYVKSDDGRYFNPYTGKEVLRINETPDGRTITLMSADGHETTINKDTPIESLREWVNDGSTRVRYSALEDAFLGKNVDLSPLVKEVANTPGLNSITSPTDAAEQLRALANQEGLVRTTGLAQDMSYSRLQEFRELGAEAFNLPSYDQQLRDLTGDRLKLTPDPTLSQFTGFTQNDTVTALSEGWKDLQRGGEGITPNLLPTQNLIDRAGLLIRGLRETFNPSAFGELPGSTYVSLLGENKSAEGKIVPGNPFTLYNNSLMISQGPNVPESRTFYVGMHEMEHLLERTNPISDTYWTQQVYGSDNPGVYSPAWPKLLVLPPGMSDPYSAAAAEEHRANTFADMASGNFQERAAQDPAYKRAVETMGKWANLVSNGMNTAYFETIVPAALRFNFQLDQIRQRIQNLLK